MTEADDQIPTDGAHRGVPLHAGQSDARLALVRRDIDAAHALRDIDAMIAFADDPANAPEARLLARAKCLATLDDAIERRAPRARAPELNRQRIQASAAGCNSVRWQSSTRFCSALDAIGPDNYARVPRRRATLETRRMRP